MMTERYEVLVPDLGLGQQSVRAGLWRVRRGERVAEGETLLEIVAETVMVELPTPRSGRLVEKLVAEDDPVVPGQAVAVLRLGEE